MGDFETKPWIIANFARYAKSFGWLAGRLAKAVQGWLGLAGAGWGWLGLGEGGGGRAQGELA
ncbi:MAG: hypothetical protein AB1735_10550, partial [Pseudomonadota bacterium]